MCVCACSRLLCFTVSHSPTLPYCCVCNICLSFKYTFLIYLEEGKTEEPMQRELMVSTKSAVNNAKINVIYAFMSRSPPACQRGNGHG